MKKIVMVILFAGTMIGLSACNTMSGVGKDVQKGGEKLENSAESHK